MSGSSGCRLRAIERALYLLVSGRQARPGPRWPARLEHTCVALRAAGRPTARHPPHCRLDARPLPSCAGGEGPCAVWEVSSGRVVLDAGLVGRIGAVPQLGSLLQQFTGELFSQAQAAAGRQGADQVGGCGVVWVHPRGSGAPC